MKFLTFILFFVSLLGCSNDDDNPQDPISQLPPITTTGAGTFGCLVNGELFVDNSGRFNCFYQLVDGEYFFNICGLDERGLLTDICLRTNRKEIGINESHDIESNDIGNFFASVAVDDNGLRFFDSSLATIGTITFTEFNLNSNVVSATFEFTVTDPETEVAYEVTDGRFDALFTQ